MVYDTRRDNPCALAAIVLATEKVLIGFRTLVCEQGRPTLTTFEISHRNLSRMIERNLRVSCVRSSKSTSNPSRTLHNHYTGCRSARRRLHMVQRFLMVALCTSVVQRDGGRYLSTEKGAMESIERSVKVTGYYSQIYTAVLTPESSCT